MGWQHDEPPEPPEPLTVGEIVYFAVFFGVIVGVLAVKWCG